MSPSLAVCFVVTRHGRKCGFSPISISIIVIGIVSGYRWLQEETSPRLCPEQEEMLKVLGNHALPRDYVTRGDVCTETQWDMSEVSSE